MTWAVTTFIFCAALKYACGFLPLKSDSAYGLHANRGCFFGDRLHEFGSSWHPNLGKPFGVMYCVRCECARKGSQCRTYQGLNTKTNVERTIAPPLAAANEEDGFSKVICQDIRKFCPATECKNAKVQRGECCPTCPEAAKTVDWEVHERKSRFVSTLNDDGNTMDAKDSKKYYAIVLNPETQKRIFVGRSTITLHRRNLHFTVQYSEHNKPRAIHLLNNQSDEILSYDVAADTISANLVCGVWRNLPKNIINALQDQKLSMKVVLNHKGSTNSSGKVNESSVVGPFSEEDVAIGRIQTHRALAAETFSAVLRKESEADDESKGGATAIITLSTNLKRIEFVVVFRNIAPKNDRRRKTSQPLIVNLELRSDANDTLRQTNVRITSEKEEIANSWKANADLLRALGEGSLHLILEARVGRRGKVGRYIGEIKTKATCNLIQAVVSGNDCNPPKATGSVGSVMLHINSDNTVSYQMIFSEFESRVTSIQFRASYRKRRIRVITDVTAQFHNGEAAGVMKGISARELHLLQNHGSWVTVTTALHPHCEIQGPIRSLLYNGDSARHKALPIALAGSLVSPPVSTGAGGHAWLHLDKNCDLHYEIVVSGLSKDSDSSVAAHLHGLAEISGLEPAHKKLLKGFYGTEARGILREIPNELYQLMDDGLAYVQIATKKNPNGEIRGKVHIENTCMSSNENDGDGSVNKATEKSHLPRKFTPNKSSSPESCQFEGDWHDHDTQWLPKFDRSCTTCSCWQGRVTCEPVSCPPTACPHPVITAPQCCPICDESSSYQSKPAEELHSIASLIPYNDMNRNRHNENSRQVPSAARDGCYQDGDAMFHPVGTSWNPHVAPFGRIACVTCTCRGYNDYSCARITCPHAPCAYPKRRKPDDCCKVCFDSEASASRNGGINLPPKPGWLQDSSSDGMCTFGRDLYAVGSSWKPNARGIGQMQCITCSCEKDSDKGVKVRCKRRCANAGSED